jgi:hypothetical protein
MKGNRAMRGIISIIIGLIMIIGGLSGNLVLVGTNSGGALAGVGVIVLIIGAVRVTSALKKKE